MNMIVAADKNWAIGYQGQLLVSIPEERKLLREETAGKIVIMGRKMLESFPGGQPLAGRKNIILSKDPDYSVKGACVCHSVEEVLKEVEESPKEDVFVIGGESVYRQFLPYCHAVHAARIDYTYNADSYFADLDQDPEWQLEVESEEQTYFDICYTFQMYVRVRQ